MSKSARKHIPARKPIKPHHETKPAPKFNFKSPAVAIVVTAVLAAIPFIMGKYIEFNSPDPFDSGSYVYSAEHIVHYLWWHDGRICWEAFHRGNHTGDYPGSADVCLGVGMGKEIARHGP